MAFSSKLAAHLSTNSLLCILFLLLLNVIPAHSAGHHHHAESNGCEREIELGECHNESQAFTLNLVAIGVVFLCSLVGVGIPLICGSMPAMRPDRSLFVLIKTFAAGVILGTAFLHVLPEAFSSLGSPCLPESPWRKFPFAGLVAMLAAIFTLMVDSVMTVILSRKRKCMILPEVTESATSINEDLQILKSSKEAANVSHHRVVAQVLELGILTHSVVIGLSMGASHNVCTIRPLIVTLCFHQMFEGMGLGGCILQAMYGTKMKTIMIFLFSITTPIGIIVGLALAEVYSDNNPQALVILGLLNSAAAGLLICMALVDLLAAEFMGPKLQSSVKLQASAYASVFVGAGIMAIMAIWA